MELSISGDSSFQVPNLIDKTDVVSSCGLGRKPDKVTRDRALCNWVFDETAENMHRNFGSGYPGGNISYLYINCVRILSSSPFATLSFSYNISIISVIVKDCH